MFIKLLPEQIAGNWEVVKYSMRRAMAEVADLDSDEAMSRVLEEILVGKLSVWVSVPKKKKDDDEDGLIDMIVTTTVSSDYCSGTDSLLIYTVYSPRGTCLESWLEGYKTLSREALRLGCKQIIAYSNDRKIINIVKKLEGFVTNFISLDLYDNVKEAIDESLFKDSD